MHDYYRMVAVFEPLQRPAKGRTERTLPIGTRDMIAGHAKKLDQGYFLHEPSSKPPESHLLHRGQAASPGPRSAPAFRPCSSSRNRRFPAPPEGATTSQRRLTLASWLIDPNNPLTTRVIVNRVWQYHFGFGLVRTSSDFGTTGDPPTHPELLDWLARWFVDHGRSLKALHRLIVTSNTYQQSTTFNVQARQTRPREPPAMAHALSPARGRGDPRRDALRQWRAQPADVWAQYVSGSPRGGPRRQQRPGQIWPPFHEATASRRTIYAFVKRSLIVPMFDVLDFCDTARSAARRNVTSVPTQALTLLNGDFVNRQARHLADRVEREAGPDPAAQIERAYQLSLCRSPREGERSALLEFLRREGMGRLAEAAADGRADHGRPGSSRSTRASLSGDL